MTTRYPCPNPTCIHEFDGSELAGAASVTCPVCGMVLQLRANPAAAQNVTAAAPVAQPAAVPLATTVSAVPFAQPVHPIPQALPVTQPMSMAARAAAPVAEAAPNVFDDGAPIVRGTRTPKRRDWLTYTAVIGGFILLVGFGVGAYLVGFRGGSVGDTSFSPSRSTDFNIQFQSPGKPWQSHEGLKASLPASLLAMHRENPSAWMAIDARKFDHDPAPRELDAEARRKLGKYLRNLETDPPVGSPPKEGDSVANQTTHRFVFLGDMFLRETGEGERQTERVAGECVMFKFQGIGYWIYTWMPVEVTKDQQLKDQVTAQFAELRRRVSLIGERDEWKQQQDRRTVFAGKSADYQLIDRTGRWQHWPDEDPKEADEKADLVLFAPAPNARNRIERLQTRKTLVVLLLPASKDGVASAREYLLEKYRKLSDKAAIEPADDSSETFAMPGEPSGKVVQWRVIMGPGSSQFVVAGVASRTNELIVAYAECDWNERNANEILFQSIVSSLQKKAE